MSARKGQVALYLVLVLVALAVLTLMNVNVFLAVRAKNHATSAGDAAALQAAHVQAELLNEIGRENARRLKEAISNRLPDYDADSDLIRRRCFLGPLRALRESNQAARDALEGMDNGGLESFETASMTAILRQHVFDIRNLFEPCPDLYPEPWEGAWEEYAQELELILSDELVAGPDNCEFANDYREFPLWDQNFYAAIKGENHCWFKNNNHMEAFGWNSLNMPQPQKVRGNGYFNSEIYSLHLTVQSLPTQLKPEMKKVIMRLANCSLADIENSWVLTNGMHKFAFYDHRWNTWSTYHTQDYAIDFRPDVFPIRGPVKAKYDVLGCAAICRVRRQVPDCLNESPDSAPYDWTAAAKPFGYEINLNGDEDVVTCLMRFVTPVFREVHLVPVDSVGGRDLHTADEEWMRHVRDHIPEYLDSGISRLSGGCGYCEALIKWEPLSFRQAMRNAANIDPCWVHVPPGDSYGGTAHAH